jgi:uncharacterized protein YoxC
MEVLIGVGIAVGILAELIGFFVIVWKGGSTIRSITDRLDHGAEVDQGLLSAVSKLDDRTDDLSEQVAVLNHHVGIARPHRPE